MIKTMTEINKIVFILDIFDANVEYFETMVMSVKRLIEDINDSTFVGVVMFDNRTRISHKLVQLSSNRMDVLDSLTNLETNVIDIESGLRAGLKVINEDGQNIYNTTFILIVKHKDRYGTYVKNMLPQLIINKVRVICIAVGPNADEKLELLAKGNDGQIYRVNDPDMLTTCIHSLMDVHGIGERSAENQMITVCEETIWIKEKALTKAIAIDSEIGRNVTFQISSKNHDKLSCELKSPFDLVSGTSVKFARDDRLKRFVFKTHSVEPGYWTICIRNNSKKEVMVSLLVKCEGVDETPIRMNVNLIEADVYNPSPPIIVAELMKGTDIVIGAQVIATIDCPDGTQRNVTLKNYKETIYCAHFTDYRGAGLYNVTVFATNNEDNCVIMNPYNKSPVNGEVPHFERQKSAGCFTITDCMLNVSNLKPPNELKQKLLELSTKWIPNTPPNVSPIIPHSLPLIHNNEVNPQQNKKSSKFFVPTPFAQAIQGVPTLAPSLKSRPSSVIGPTAPSLLARSVSQIMAVKPQTIPSTPSMIMPSTPSAPYPSIPSPPYSSVPSHNYPSTPQAMTSSTPSLYQSYQNTILLPMNSSNTILPLDTQSQNQGPVPIARQLKQDNSNMTEMEGTLLQSLLVVQKSINSKKISDSDRNEIKSSIMAIDSYLSNKNKTVQQLKSYQDILDQWQNKLFN